MERQMKTNNPNYDIFEIEPEFGADEDDRRLASIGDATMKHVYSLSGAQRQLWDELIHTKDGNIFRIVPSFNPNDQDPMSLKGKDVERYLDKFKDANLNKNFMVAFQEAMEQENERREKSQDVFDLGLTIPYDEWEKMPQLWSAIDIPTVPKNRFIYMGNSKQQFYDLYPEGHPDAKFINDMINILNRRWDEEIDEKYAEWIKDNVIYPSNVKPYVKKAFERVLDLYVTTSANIEDLAEKALAYIDDQHRLEYKREAYSHLKSDQMFQMIVHYFKEWESMEKEGKFPYSQVKKFGQTIYNNPSLRRQMKPFHWAIYFRIKRKFSPKVLIRGYDINKCKIAEIQKALNVNRGLAENIWHNRPFENFAMMYHRGFVPKSTFSSSDKSNKFLDTIEVFSKEVLVSKNLNKFSNLRSNIMLAQQENTEELEPSEWRMIWSYYKLSKEDVLRKINAKKEEKNV